MEGATVYHKHHETIMKHSWTLMGILLWSGGFYDSYMSMYWTTLLGANGRSVSDHKLSIHWEKLATCAFFVFTELAQSFGTQRTDTESFHCFVVFFKQTVCQKLQSTMWDNLSWFYKKTSSYNQESQNWIWYEMLSLDLLPFQQETSPPPCLVSSGLAVPVSGYPLSPKVEGELWRVVVSMMMGRYAADWGESLLTAMLEDANLKWKKWTMTTFTIQKLS